jgi:hypothetical protein
MKRYFSTADASRSPSLPSIVSKKYIAALALSDYQVYQAIATAQAGATFADSTLSGRKVQRLAKQSMFVTTGASDTL